MFTLGAVIPCHNEAERLKKDEFVLFARQNPQIVLVFIDDGSTDETLTILQHIQLEVKENIFLLSLEGNTGKGHAIHYAINYLLSQFNPPFIGFIDADLSTPLSELNNLFHFLQHQKTDFVLGSRIKKLGSIIERTYFRHYAGRIIATIIDERFKLGCYDTQCGAKLFKTPVLAKAVKEPFYTKWFFDVEILLRIRKEFNVLNGIEYPLTVWHHVKSSKINLLSFPLVFKELLKLLIKYKHCK
jgi:dolichyl-phosphate beta-glucosyltransferase